MPGSFSDYLENKILDHLRGTSYTAPSGLYIGLFSTTEGDAGGGTEVTTTIRPAGRVAVTMGAASGGSMSNSAIADFGASAGAATVTYFGVFDAASAGNLLFAGPVTTTLSITTGINVSWPIGSLVVSLD